MKRALVLVSLLACSSSPPAARAPRKYTVSKPKIVWQEPFEAELPTGWKSPSGASSEVISQVYVVSQDGGQRFLSAHHDGAGSAAPPAVHWGMPWRDEPIDLYEACSLSWRWRVIEHPTVEEDPWRDVAVSVYVVMSQPGLFSKGKGFKFGWLSKPGPKDTTQRGLVQIALRTGGATDTWKHEQVDLCRLYERYFGDPYQEKLMYVGIVSDADDSKSRAIGHYDDFVLSTAPLQSNKDALKP